MKSDVFYHMETIAQSRVKASVSVHGKWVFLTVHGLNAGMLWESLVLCVFNGENTLQPTCGYPHCTPDRDAPAATGVQPLV